MNIQESTPFFDSDELGIILNRAAELSVNQASSSDLAEIGSEADIPAQCMEQAIREHLQEAKSKKPSPLINCSETTIYLGPFTVEQWAFGSIIFIFNTAVFGLILGLNLLIVHAIVLVNFMTWIIAEKFWKYRFYREV